MLGEKQVPKDAYYGIQTMRALENFPITGIPISRFPNLIRALAFVKKAAVITNFRLGLLNVAIEEVIITACDEILARRLHEHFGLFPDLLAEFFNSLIRLIICFCPKLLAENRLQRELLLDSQF